MPRAGRSATICSPSTRRIGRRCRTTCARRSQPLLDAVEALGLPLLRISGVEADDVIGTLALRGPRQAAAVLISTGDKDMAQLVETGHHADQHDEQHRAGPRGVKAKFDVFPEQIIDYLALVGDSSDNIPGIEQGRAEDRRQMAEPVRDARWAGREHAARSPARSARTCAAGSSRLALSRKLATIHTDLALALSGLKS